MVRVTFGFCGIDGILLNEITVADHGLHEFVGDLHRDIGPGNFPGFQFGIDEMLGIGMNARRC